MSSRATIQLSRVPDLFWLSAGCLLLLSALWTVVLHGEMDMLCALLVAGVFFVISWYSKTTACLLTLGFLNVLGDVRRLVAAAFGAPPLDLLLLVGPVMALVLGFPLLLRVRLKDSLSKAMLFLLVIMCLEIVNPQQGGLAVGLSGALFYIVPVLWFWIGRRYASSAVVERLLYRLILPLAIAAALLGLAQTFVGFLPYEQAWIDVAAKNYQALYVGNSVRAFGFSVSSAEYATLLEIGVIVTASAAIASKRIWALAIPLLLTVMVLSSSRSLILRMLLSLSVVWSLRTGRKPKPRTLVYFAVLLVIGLFAINVIASRFASTNDNNRTNSAVQGLIAHQADGLAHPWDQRYSTAGLHRDMVLSGITQGFTDPIGRGLGSTTLAASKFSSDPNLGSSEIDISDMFTSLGIVGGLAYLCILFQVLKRLLTYVQTVHLSISLPVLAILTSSLGAWLIGGQYSTSCMIFFLIGALAHSNRSETTNATDWNATLDRSLGPVAYPDLSGTPVGEV